MVYANLKLITSFSDILKYSLVETVVALGHFCIIIPVTVNGANNTISVAYNFCLASLHLVNSNLFRRCVERNSHLILSSLVN